MKIRKYHLKKEQKQTNLDKLLKSYLISKSHNPWINQEAQLWTNWILKDEIGEKYYEKKLAKESKKEQREIWG